MLIFSSPMILVKYVLYNYGLCVLGKEKVERKGLLCRVSLLGIFKVLWKEQRCPKTASVSGMFSMDQHETCRK